MLKMADQLPYLPGVGQVVKGAGVREALLRVLANG